MARTKTLREKRDAFIRNRFKYHKKKNPKWHTAHWIAAVADDIFLEPVTVAKILKGYNEKVPSHPTIHKKLALQQAV